MPPELRTPILMIPSRPIHKAEDLKLYKTLPISPEPKKTSNVTPSPRLGSAPLTERSRGVEPSTTTNSSIKPSPLITVLSEQGEFDNFVKNNLKGLNSNVKVERLKKMMECYRDDFYRDVPLLMQTEHNFYDYLVKRRFPELIHYLGLTSTTPKNFPIKSDQPEYYLKIERIILPLARTLGFKEVETFKKTLAFSSFQKGFGDYLTGVNYSADGRVVQILTKGKETVVSFHSAPVIEVSKPALPEAALTLTTAQKRKALIFYLKHYFVGKEKETFMNEINYVYNDKRIDMTWEIFEKSIESRAKADEKTDHLYFEPIAYEKIMSEAGIRCNPLKKKQCSNPRKIKYYIRVHGGEDLKAKVGTGILLPLKGKVLYASNRTRDDEGKLISTGKIIIVDHQNGLITAYMHLSEIDEKIKAGVDVPFAYPIGKTGATGPVTGPHLHFRIKDKDNTYSYEYQTMIKVFVKYVNKRVKRNKKWRTVKQPKYKERPYKKEVENHIATIKDKTLFLQKTARLSAGQLKAKSEKKYAEYLQVQLALNETAKK